MVVVLQVLCHYEFMIEIGPLMSENQVKKSLSCVASPHLTQLGEGALHKMLDSKEKKKKKEDHRLVSADVTTLDMQSV